jgi:hypothetical protein
MHAPTRSPTTSKCLKHLILGSLGQFLFTKIIYSRWSICNQHLQNAMKIPTMEKIITILICLARISKTCRANKPTIGNLCSSPCHEDNAHLQLSTLVVTKCIKLSWHKCSQIFYTNFHGLKKYITLGIWTPRVNLLTKHKWPINIL